MRKLHLQEICFTATICIWYYRLDFQINSIFGFLKYNGKSVCEPEWGKKAAVESMFDSIAWRYDFLNHFLSFNFDRIWRRRAIKIISKSYKSPDILDVATGTGDLAIAAMKLNPVRISGIDISNKMLESVVRKLKRKGFSRNNRSYYLAIRRNIPFDDNVFDVAMVAFGVRNFSDPLKGLSEMNRVIRHRRHDYGAGIFKAFRFSFQIDL